MYCSSHHKNNTFIKRVYFTSQDSCRRLYRCVQFLPYCTTYSNHTVRQENRSTKNLIHTCVSQSGYLSPIHQSQRFGSSSLIH